MTCDDHVRYAPLYLHSFPLNAPRQMLDAQRLNRRYRCYEEIDNVQDRMRWCRHRMGLMQKDVVDKLAALFGVPVDDLTDDYNRFLHYGQGRAIREYRESLGLKKKPFARLLYLDPHNLQIWETERKRVVKGSWEKYFKNRIQV